MGKPADIVNGQVMNTFEGILTLKSYLCVPIGNSVDEDLSTEDVESKPRDVTFKNFIDNWLRSL